MYRRPIAIFFFPEPPEEETLRASFRTLPEHELRALPVRIVRLIRTARAMQANLFELCEGRNPAERQILRDIRLSGTSEEVSSVAKAVRDYLGISLAEQKTWRRPADAFRRWRAALEDAGIFVFKDAFGHDEFSGFCLHDYQFPIIYVNNSVAETRQIFTLFHELAHLLLGIGGVDKLGDGFIRELPEEERRVEVFVNRFAGTFLVPDDDLDRRLAGEFELTETFIEQLASTYKVSREVILRKLLDRSLVTADEYEELALKWAGQVADERSDGGNYYRTKVSYLGDRYLSLAFRAFYARRISEAQLARYLGVKVDHIPKVEAAWAGRLQ